MRSGHTKIKTQMKEKSRMSGERLGFDYTRQERKGESAYREDCLGIL